MRTVEIGLRKNWWLLKITFKVGYQCEVTLPECLWVIRSADRKWCSDFFFFLWLQDLSIEVGCRVRNSSSSALLEYRQPPPNSLKSDLSNSPSLNEVALFLGLFIACEKREGDLQSSFISKPQCYPSSFCRINELRLCKDYLVIYLENKVNSAPCCDPADTATEVSLSRSWIFWGQLSLWLFFFSPEIMHQQGYSVQQQTVKNVSKLDITFDAYQLNSLKGTTMNRLGQGFWERIKDI